MLCKPTFVSSNVTLFDLPAELAFEVLRAVLLTTNEQAFFSFVILLKKLTKYLSDSVDSTLNDCEIRCSLGRAARLV